MSKDKSKTNKSDLELVSFKLGKEVFAKLKAYSKTQVDSAGIKLSPSQVARELMLESLWKHLKNP